MLTVPEVKGLLKQGLTDAEIADILGYSKYQIHRFRKVNNIPSSKEFKRDNITNKITRLNNQCINQKELAEKVGLSQSRVSEIITENKLNIDFKQKEKIQKGNKKREEKIIQEKELVEKIKHLQLTQGLSDKDIGKVYNKSKDEIKYIRRKYKIDTSLRQQYLEKIEKERVDLIKSNLDRCIKIEEMVKLTSISKSIVTKLMQKYKLQFNKKIYCINCGKELTIGSNRKAKLCGDKCREEYKYKNKINLCKVCGKEIKGGSTYCSDECKRNVDLICKICGKKFKGFHTEKFCSSNCKDESERIRYVEHISREIEVECEICGAPMMIKANSKRHRVCSLKCKNKYLDFRVNNSLEKLFGTTDEKAIKELVRRKMNEKTC